MHSITHLSDASNNLQALYRQAIDDREIVVIQGDNDDEQVALIAIDELQSLLEVAHLLKSPNNAQRLLTALQRAKAETLPSQNVDQLKQQLLSED